jgi:hypothetical protein
MKRSREDSDSKKLRVTAKRTQALGGVQYLFQGFDDQEVREDGAKEWDIWPLVSWTILPLFFLFRSWGIKRFFRALYGETLNPWTRSR